METCALPENLLLRVLTRLPVKSIARFKSVCKRWRHLFSTPEFLKLRQSVIVHRIYRNFSDVSFVNIDSSAVTPSAIDYRDGVIVGCCNGLVCVSYGKVIVLLNPATLMFSKVALSTLESYGAFVYERVSLGFGYDAGADDFKVVRFFRLKKKLSKREQITVYDDGVEVYSCNSGSWTAIGSGFQFINLKGRSKFVVNGNPYWVAEVYGYEDDEVLVCFDVRKLVFRIVPLGALDLYVNPQFVEWKGSLGALVTTKVEEDDGRVVKSLDVWVFDDGMQIWRKNRTFVGPSEVNVDMFLECSKNGKFVGECADGRLFVFDTETGFVSAVLLFNPGRSHEHAEIYPYTESLAYIKGMKQV